MATYGRVHSNMREQRQCSLSMVEIDHIVCVCVCAHICVACSCVHICTCILILFKNFICGIN